MEKSQKLWNVLVLGPLIIAPLLAVEFPRVLAYLPLISLVFGLGILFFIKQKITLPTKPFVVIAVLIIALVIHSLLFSHYPESSLDRVKKLALILPLGALFLVVLKTGASMTSQHFLKWIAGACALAALCTSYEMFSEGWLYKIIRPDTDLTLFGTAVFNRGALTITFMALTAFCLSRNKQNKFLILGLAPVFLMFFLIESQSAQIALIVGAFVYFLFPISKSYAWFGSFVFIVVCVVCAPFIVKVGFRMLPADIYDYHLLQQSFVGHRFEIWNFVITQVFESPLLGHGVEFTKNYDGFKTEGRFLMYNTVLHPHNFIVQTWIEVGLVGVLSACALIGMVFKFLHGLEDMFLKRAALTMFLTIIFVACFSYGMWQSWWLGLIFIVAGIFCASHKIVKTG